MSALPCPVECPISRPTKSFLLHDAAAGGHLETTRFLVSKKGQGPRDSDKDGNVPLHHAAHNGKLEVVSFLAGHSDPDIRGNRNWTPLHFACRQGHLEVVKHLVEVRNASAKVEDEGGRNAGHFAACSGNLDLVRFLDQKKGLVSGHQCHAGCTVLHYAAYEGHLDTIRFLASRKGEAGEIASVDNYGNTALHHATVAGRADVVALLLNEFNCNPNLQNADGDTCLHIACQESHLEVVKVLAAHHSTNRALQNKSGHTPQEIADTKNLDSVVQVLRDSTLLTAVEEPPAKKPRLSDDTELGPSEGSSESHTLVSDPTQSPSNAGPPLSQSSTSTGTEGQQNIPESDVESTHVRDEQLDLEDDGNEPGLSLVDLPPEFHAKLMPFIKRHAKLTGNTLGYGTYGSVEEIDIRGRLYAGKLFKVQEKNRFYKHLCSEICIISSLDHPNIVTYCGVCVVANVSLPILLMERLENNLHDFVLASPSADIALTTKQSILHNVSCCLNYLHTHDAVVIHRDLTTKNVLLDSALRAKITDFGNARIIKPNTFRFLETMTARPGTIEYMPPEAFEDGCKYTVKLDIFSFGHLALVTCIQENAHPLLNHTYMKKNEQGKRQRAPRTEENRRKRFVEKLFNVVGPVGHSLTDLILKCLHNQPEKRPTAAELQKHLDKLCMSSDGKSASTLSKEHNLDLNDAKTVIDYLHQVQRDKIRQLALVLGIHTQTIDKWNTSGARQFLDDFVSAWLRGQDGTETATWKRLIEGLNHHTVGHTGIASMITEEQM